MKIIIELSSLDEISEFQKVYVGGNNIIDDFIKEEVKNRMPKEAPTEEKPKKEEPEKEDPAEEEPKKEEPEEDVEKITVEVRKILLKVNRKEGRNIAREWVKELGYKELPEVNNAKDLLKLKEKAEEVLNA